MYFLRKYRLPAVILSIGDLLLLIGVIRRFSFIPISAYRLTHEAVVLEWLFYLSCIISAFLFFNRHAPVAGIWRCFLPSIVLYVIWIGMPIY